MVSAKTYRCPGCGRRVKFGTHFCSGEAEARLDDPMPEKPPWRHTLTRIGVVLVASALVISLLWTVLGFYAYLLIAVVGIIVTAILIVDRSGRRLGEPGYRELLKLTGGDRNQAERLIAAEAARYPDFSRAQCIRRAHDKLEYDRRR